MATPNRCKAVVPQINPKTNNRGLAAAGTSNPWAVPWKKPKIPTKNIIAFVGIFLSILIANPKRITERTIPIDFIENSTPTHKPRLIKILLLYSLIIIRTFWF